MPGKAYWVRVHQQCKLILSSTPSNNPLSRIRIVHASEQPPAAPEDHAGISSNAVPAEFALDQNYPNPFNPTTTIRYQLPTDSRVSLQIINLLGQVVGILSDETQSAGYKSINWNASSFASGIYFCRMEAVSAADPMKTFTQVRKVVLIR
jgi:hypothetical protein